MKWTYAILIAIMVMLTACTNNQPENKMPDVNKEAEPEVKDEGTDDSGRAIDEIEEAIDETDDAVENAGEIIEDTISDDTVFCETGGVYKYASEGGDVESIIIGLETYKGKEFCRAESTTTIESQMGDIDTDTTYYYNEDASEMWVITVTSSEFMPQPQTSEIHIVDGKVVN